MTFKTSLVGFPDVKPAGWDEVSFRGLPCHYTAGPAPGRADPRDENKHVCRHLGSKGGPDRACLSLKATRGAAGPALGA